ncbi:MAG: DUF975 family protein [Bacillota bacterium]
MWTRAGLKQQAKDFLKRHYWKAFAVCLIVAIVTGGSGKSEKDVDTDNNIYNETFTSSREYIIDLSPRNEIINFTTEGMGFDNPLVFSTTFGVFVAFFIFASIVGIIIGNALQVGEKRFFLRGFENDVKIGNLFSTFKKGQWLPIAGKIFLLELYIFLWTLLLIIPGIIKYYQYRMVPYILSEDPEMPLREAIEISTRMTDGQKGDIFLLDLSFIGWYLLGLLFFGIGGIFVRPYHEATVAKLFEHYIGLREEEPILEY